MSCENINVADKKIACKRCGKSFRTKLKHKAHRKRNIEKGCVRKKIVSIGDESQKQELVKCAIIGNENDVSEIEETKWKRKCRHCNKEFSNKEKLKSHKMRTHKTNRNDLSKTAPEDVIIIDDDELVSAKIESVKKYSCNVCGKEYEKKVKLKSHKRRKHCMKKSGMCDKVVVDLTKDETEVNNNEPILKKQLYKCKYCPKQYKTKEKRKRHRLKKHNIKEKTNVEIESHEATDNELPSNIECYTCEICDKVFTHRRSLNQHKVIHTDQSRWKYQCEYCEERFYKSNLCKLHVANHHDASQKKHKCSYCATAFFKAGDLVTHIRVHTQEKPFKCMYCKKCLTQKSHLTEHVRTHTDERPYKCGCCDKAFKIGSDLKRHERIHSGEKPYKCNICGRKFRQTGHVSKHKNRMHPTDE